MQSCDGIRKDGPDDELLVPAGVTADVALDPPPLSDEDGG